MSHEPQGRVAGKVAIVTGGAGGIGGATAHALARHGASVAVVDIDGDGGERVAGEIRSLGGEPLAVFADLAAEAEIAGAIRTVVDHFGRLDVLHNNAALTESDFLSRDTQVTDLALEVWERTMAVNLRSQMLTCKHAIPEMVRHGGGSIINMSSGASLKGDRTRTAYGVSKAGVNTLTMYVATSHGKQGVRVNTIVPGLIITDAVRAHLTERMLAGLGRATLTPYLGEPDDVANLVVFLASDESRYITGQMIAIDGGMSAHVGAPARTGEDRRGLRPEMTGHAPSGRSENVGTGVGMVVPAARGLGPAVDMDGLARHVAGQLAGQEDGGARHLVHVAGPAHGYGETEALLGPGRRHRRHALGQGDVGGQGVHPDAVGSQLQGGGLGEVDDPGLGRGVGGVPGRGPDPFDRGHADDAAAAYPPRPWPGPRAGCTG